MEFLCLVVSVLNGCSDCSPSGKSRKSIDSINGERWGSTQLVSIPGLIGNGSSLVALPLNLSENSSGNERNLWK